jgi:hypothetical protein
MAVSGGVPSTMTVGEGPPVKGSSPWNKAIGQVCGPSSLGEFAVKTTVRVPPGQRLFALDCILRRVIVCPSDATSAAQDWEVAPWHWLKDTAAGPTTTKSPTEIVALSAPFSSDDGPFVSVIVCVTKLEGCTCDGVEAAVNELGAAAAPEAKIRQAPARSSGRRWRRNNGRDLERG